MSYRNRVPGSSILAESDCEQAGDLRESLFAWWIGLVRSSISDIRLDINASYDRFAIPFAWATTMVSTIHFRAVA